MSFQKNILHKIKPKLKVALASVDYPLDMLESKKKIKKILDYDCQTVVKQSPLSCLYIFTVSKSVEDTPVYAIAFLYFSYDQADALGLYPEDPSSQGRQQPAFKDL